MGRERPGGCAYGVYGATRPRALQPTENLVFSLRLGRTVSSVCRETFARAAGGGPGAPPSIPGPRAAPPAFSLLSRPLGVGARELGPCAHWPCLNMPCLARRRPPPMPPPPPQDSYVQNGSIVSHSEKKALSPRTELDTVCSATSSARSSYTDHDRTTATEHAVRSSTSLKVSVLSKS